MTFRLKHLLLAFLLALPAFADDMVQSTQQTRPFLLLDSTTGLPKTGVTITGITGVIIQSRGLSGGAASTKTSFTCAASSPNKCVEIGSGWYDVEFTTGNTSALRDLAVSITASGALTSKRYFYVVAAASDSGNTQGNLLDATAVGNAVWAHATGAAVATNADTPTSSVVALLPASLVGGKMDSAVSGAVGSVTGAVGSVAGNVGGNVVGTIGGLAAQAKLDVVFHQGILPGTAQSATASTIQLAAGAGASNNQYAWWLVTLTGGTGAGQTAQIQSYVGATKTASIFMQGTVTGNWVVTPDATTTYSLIPARR